MVEKRRRRRRSDRWGWALPLLAYLLLAGAVVVALDGTVSQKDFNKAEVQHRLDDRMAARRAARKLRRAQIVACKRVNLLRAQSNVSNDVSFGILSVAAQRELALADVGLNAGIHSRSAAGLISQASRLPVTDLTSCPEATDHPASYRYPLAGPIGDPITGKQSPIVRRIIERSERLVRQHSRRVTQRLVQRPT